MRVALKNEFQVSLWQLLYWKCWPHWLGDLCPRPLAQAAQPRGLDALVLRGHGSALLLDTTFPAPDLGLPLIPHHRAPLLPHRPFFPPGQSLRFSREREQRNIVGKSHQSVSSEIILSYVCVKTYTFADLFQINFQCPHQ